MRMFLPITNRKPVMAAGKYSHKKSRFCLIQKKLDTGWHRPDRSHEKREIITREGLLFTGTCKKSMKY